MGTVTAMRVWNFVQTQWGKRFPRRVPYLQQLTTVECGAACLALVFTEQYSCTWSQVHLDCRTIELTKTKNGTARTIHLNSDAVAAIMSLKHPRLRQFDSVFPRGGTKARFDTRSWFVPCLAEVEITGYVWHLNRHTVCSWLAMAGASIQEIHEAAGHKTITMSARYSHLSPAHKLSVVERIAGTATKRPPAA